MNLKGKRTIGRFIAMLYRMAGIYLGKELSQLNIGAGQYAFLAELYDEEGQSQEELTQKAGVDKANTARALGRLERVGYVKRISDARDQRVKRVFLEPPAHEIEEDFWRIICEWSDILTRNIPPERQDRLLADLEQMAENAAAYLKRY